MSLVSKTFGDVISLSRATGAATRINAAGVVESIAANQPRFDYDQITHSALGLLIAAQRTRLNTVSAAPVSAESIAVSQGYYTVSFFGAGSVTLSGAYAGTVAGVGATRTTATIQTSAGTLVLTPSGDVSNLQVEAGTQATSLITGEGSRVTVVADQATIDTAQQWFSAAAGTFVIEHDAPAGQALISIGGTTVVSSYGPGKTAISYDANGVYSSHQGGQIVWHKTVTWSGVMRIFPAADGAECHLSNFEYFPRKISDIRALSGPLGQTADAIAFSSPVTPAVYYGVVPLAGYSGAAFDVVRPSDSASITVGFSGQKLDTAALAAFLGNETGQITKLYDQIGSKHTPTAASNRPKIRTDITINGIPSLIFDGSNGSPVITAQLDLPSSVALNVRNVSMLFFGRQTIGQNTSCLVSLKDGTPATIGKFEVLNGQSFVAGSTQTTPQYVPSNPGVFGVTSSESNVKHYIAERSFSRSAITGSGVSSGGMIANDLSGVRRGKFEAMAISLYDGVLPAGAMAAARMSFEGSLGVQSDFDNTIGLTGDSILEGTGTTLCQNLTRQLDVALPKRSRIINAGVFGATMAAIPAAPNYFNAFKGWSQKRLIWILEACANDIAAGTSASAIATIAQARIADARTALIDRVGIATCLPRYNWVSDSAKWVAAQAYNDLVRANYAAWGADFVVDLAANPVMGNIANTSNATLFTDLLHPSSYGNSLLVPDYVAAITPHLA